MAITRLQDAADILSPPQKREIARPRFNQAALVGAIFMFALLIALYIASIDIWATRGASITGDEPFYLLTTQSLLQDGDLDLRQQYAQRSYESFFDHPGGLWQQSVPREDGVLLSPHNPGLSVLLLPGFVIAGLVGAQVQMLVMAALTFALTYVLVVSLTRESLWSWAATMLIALSATAFIYSTEIYPEIPAALALVASLIILQSKERPGLWLAVALAGCVTALMWLGIKYAPLAALVAVWFFWRAESHARLALLVVGGLSAAFFAWFHLETFGGLTPYAVGVVHASDSTSSIISQHIAFWERSYRLWGLFIDANFGIGRWSPVLLPVVPALLLLWRRSGLSRLALALVAAQILMATFVAITFMGWWFPGRTLMTVLPLLALPLALLLAQLPMWGRVGIGLLGAYSLAVTAALAKAAQAREIVIAVDPFDMQSSVFRVSNILFPDYTYWNLETWGLTAAWLLLGGAAISVMYLASSASNDKPHS